MTPESAEVATTCDNCAAPIAYDETCYAIPDGRSHDGLPVVRVLCATCHSPCATCHD